jgi:thiol-disulfide isomerase/thioredoxin
MKKRKSFLLLVFFISISIDAHSCFTNYSQERDTNVVRLNFKANEYKELILTIRCGMDSFFHSSGSLNNDSWIFKYPRSLYEKGYSFRFFIPTHTDTIQHSISFMQIVNNDTINASQYMFNNADTVIINAGLRIETRPTQGVKPVNLDDVYFLSDITDKEYLSSIELAANKFFISDVLEPDYDEIINLFTKTVRKYPDSHSLIRILYSLKRQYYIKDNVGKIYANFSDKQKQSYFGTEIQKFLSDTVFYFNNTLLPAWDTEKLEPIIQDKSKINLVIFSASWCAPCIAEIPILKKISEELGDKVAMVYVSMDDTTTVANWKKLMIDKEITWRSVLATYNLKEIKQQFFNPGFPTVLMVYPDGRYEEIEVRYDTDFKKLYQAAGKPIE